VAVVFVTTKNRRHPSVDRAIGYPTDGEGTSR